MRYRAEIDGLRAVAVIPVILFHAGFDVFSGGYVGVDVFFVISGYLITSFIANDLRRGKFSLINFYERRARRILPALFFVMLACMPIAILWLLPRDLEDFGLSLIAVAMFSSNILFWRQSGYFDAAAELKPLLHTWSLAVEEQYYILFPLFMLLAWRLGKRWILALLAAGLLLSLGAAQWGAYHKPAPAFYLLPTRGWEILLGALLAFIPQSAMRSTLPRTVSQFGSMVGMALIGYATFAFDSHTPFPGFFALVPVVGAALIIVFAVEGTVIHTVLSNRILVGIGLISYSAYLWHHPLFAFTKYRSNDEPATVTMLALCVVTLLLAWLSWRYVETPFRNRHSLSRRVIFSTSAAGFVLFVSAGVVTLSTNGFVMRYSGQEAAIIAAQEDNLHELRTVAFDRFGCFFGAPQTVEVMLRNNCVAATDQPKVILFGDSEAAHYLNGMQAALAGSGIGVQQFTGTSCRPIRHRRQSLACAEFYEAFFELLPDAATSADTVILASNWRDTFAQDGQEAFERELASTLENLKTIGVNILLVGNTPDFVFDPYAMTIRMGRAGRDNVSLPVREFANSDAVLRQAAARFDVPFFAPTDALCSGGQCVFRQDGEYLFFDAGHLSYIGSEAVSRLIIDVLEGAAGSHH